MMTRVRMASKAAKLAAVGLMSSVEAPAHWLAVSFYYAVHSTAAMSWAPPAIQGMSAAHKIHVGAPSPPLQHTLAPHHATHRGHGQQHVCRPQNTAAPTTPHHHPTPKARPHAAASSTQILLTSRLHQNRWPAYPPALTRGSKACRAPGLPDQAPTSATPPCGRVAPARLRAGCW